MILHAVDVSMTLISSNGSENKLDLTIFWAIPQTRFENTPRDEEEIKSCYRVSTVLFSYENVIIKNNSYVYTRLVHLLSIT